MWNSISENISESLSRPYKISETKNLGGGCINAAFRVSNGELAFFVKTNSGSRVDMFEAEAQALEEMRASNSVRVPKPICCGLATNSSYLVLEYIELRSVGRGNSMRQLGEQLATMHHTTKLEYGWWRDNTIGSTPQRNTLCSDWITFWRDNRLAFQLELAAQNGFRGDLQQKGEKLLTYVDRFFTDYTPDASLLHGDLWSGNYGFDDRANPVMFDPACYFGDRETDLAMTELFGGFSSEFYQAYNEAYALHKDYPIRKSLYNLYHIINHLNLFGGGYLGQAQSMIDRLLSQI